jgi:small GTP-binding protein
MSPPARTIPKVKAVLIGDSGVGKSALFRRFQDLNFVPGGTPTIGGACANITVRTTDGCSTAVMLWDTAGQESYRAIVPMYFVDCHIVLVVYAVSERISFENLKAWVNLSTEQAPVDAKILIIGNKCDEIEKRRVTAEEGQTYTQSLPRAEFFETSALNGYGIEPVLRAIGETGSEIMEARASQEISAPVEQTKTGCC